MLALIAALLSVGPADAYPVPKSVDQRRTAWIFSTIQHSEFCHAGNVRIDLRTGHYVLTPLAPRKRCNEPELERPVLLGSLSAWRLAKLRGAYTRVLDEGVISPDCQDGKEPEMIIVSNGGTPLMVVATGAFTVAPPEYLSCWSKAAKALHEALDEAFNWSHPGG